ncbi:glycosyltransferase [Paenibacillus sp. RUD330]|uniref:glycosyltransferase family 2 protein n=2 Tax=Paenibacillus TaxID=44249 RepID=UPI0032173184
MMRDARSRSQGGRREGTGAERGNEGAWKSGGFAAKVRPAGTGKGRNGRRSAGKPPASGPTSASGAEARDSDGAPPFLSVIVPVMNERRTIAAVLKQAAKIHPHTELIVVANGSTDGSAEAAERCGAKVIRYRSPLGHDVGRAVGARAAQGEILLFLDGDMVLSAAKLRPFVDAIARGGADVALNDYSGPVHTSRVHPVVLAKHALNEMLRRPDLKGTSLTAVPHAMSRRALAVIGTESLLVPPLAHAKAAAAGLRIVLPIRVDVGRRNRPRRERERLRPLHRLIIGDHLEAIAWLSRQAAAEKEAPVLPEPDNAEKTGHGGGAE